jgi:hypothetical protein
LRSLIETTHSQTLLYICDLKSAFAIGNELKGPVPDPELKPMEEQAIRFLDRLLEDLCS